MIGGLLPPILLSLKIAVIASLFVFALAATTARKMARIDFPGKSVLETALLLPLVLPPSVVGFVLLAAFGRRSPIGRAFESLFGLPIVFTWGSAVLAAVVVAYPLAYRTMKAGFESVDPELEQSARAAGAGEWQVFRYISVPLASRALTAGYILGFARGLGEFGATLMIAGNIPGRTQTIPTAIYVAVDGGRTAQAWAWAGTIALISFAMLWFAERAGRDRT
ncbi:molybdate ABC transporter permease subunit [Cohnella sp. REN36]|uniref:molybdate ABC transporter permease subunit n=1 Tax=Cohnella sp. REN36 TaxID=2887347 RepID=UPI001D14DDCA|nr:molybdate ABC transporter permease subunit [Cohnella sp. REN36]MCC3375625.1 molybdate ABC transporter permease subunit [Cohnella sp. REN36]